MFVETVIVCCGVTGVLWITRRVIPGESTFAANGLIKALCGGWFERGKNEFCEGFERGSAGDEVDGFEWSGENCCAFEERLTVCIEYALEL